MAGTIKGMTIEIGGNTAPLDQALKGVNKEISTTQKELTQVNKLLKLDPTNTELLKQKQQLLGQQIGQTTTKLDALKQAQAKLDAEMKKGGNVNQEEYRKLQREIISTEGTLKKLKDEAKNTNPHLEKMKQTLKQAGEIAGNTTKAFAEFTANGVKILASACVACAGAIGKMATSAGAFADDMNTMSAVTGLTTKQLQEFQYASDLIDVSVDTMAGSLKKLTANMNNARNGNKTAMEAFNSLGVSVTNADGTLRDNNEVFEETIRALGSIKNETERDAIAMQIFGKSATELNPLIEGGIDTLHAMGEQANELGLILSQDALDGANAFNDQMDILKANSKGLFNVIGTEIASQLTPAMEELNDITKTYIKELTSALKTGNLDDFVKTATGIIGNILSKITQGLPKIAKLGVEIVQTLISSFNENGDEIGGAIAEVLTTLVEGLYTILPDLIETAINLMTGFINTIGEKLPELIPVCVEGVLKAFDAIIDNIDKFIDAGIQLVLGLLDGIVNALPKIIQKLPELIEKIANALVDNLPKLIEAVGQIIVGLANAIGENFEPLMNAVIDTILNVATMIIDNLPTIIDSVVETILAIADALIENIDVIIDAGIQLTIALAEGLVEAIPKIVERLPEILTAIVEGLKKLAEKMWEVAKTLIEKLGEGLTIAVDGLGQALADVWEWIKDKLTEHFNNVTSIGRNLVTGIWEGIKGAKDWLLNKIREWCGSVLAGIKAFFGIESPSRVMADQVGKYMAQGIGQGFGNTMPSVIKQMQDKLSNVSNALQTQISFGDIPQFNGNNIVSENNYVTKNYTNTIETIRQPQVVELVLDNTRVARALIPALDEEYNRIGVKI